VKNYHRKGIDRAIFAADLIANAFEGVSFSDAKCMGGDYLNESCKVCTRQFTGICAIIYRSKACLKGIHHLFLEKAYFTTPPELNS